MDRDHDWPLIAEAEDDGYGGTDPGRHMQAVEQDEVDRFWLKVRRHADGRASVYGVRRARWGGIDWRGGVVLAAGEDIATAIRRIGDALDLPDRLIRECIADLPAVELA